MKISINRKILCEAVTHFTRVVSPKSTIPALEGILLSSENNTLTMVAYNLEIGMTKELEVKGFEDGDIIINAKLFADILRRMPGEMVTLTTDERLLCHIESGSAKFDIMGIAASEFPEVPTIAESRFIKLPGEVLKDMVRQTIFAVAQNEAKPIFTGILFEVERNLLRLVAVDGFRLAVRQEPVHSEESLEFVVSGKAIGEAVKIISEENQDVIIKIGKRHVCFEIDGYILISRLLEGEFLKFKSILPNESTSQLRINCPELCETVERISLIISDRIKTPIRCAVNDDEIILSCATPLGKATDSCPINLEGKELEIGFNSRYLLDALKATDTDEVLMKFSGPLAPMLIEPTDGNEFIYMVMPMRFKNEN